MVLFICNFCLKIHSSQSTLFDKLLWDLKEGLREFLYMIFANPIWFQPRVQSHLPFFWPVRIRQNVFSFSPKSSLNLYYKFTLEPICKKKRFFLNHI